VAGGVFLSTEVHVRKYFIVVVALAGIGLAGWIGAQQPAAQSAIKRTLLQRVDVPGANYEVITGVAEVPANMNIGRHTHPGVETGYVVEGMLTLLVDGEAPLALNPGESYKVAAGAVHDGRSGDRPAKAVAVYIVEKGKPLASPAP